MSDMQTDLIQPTQIEHAIDEVWNRDNLEESYNYLDYHFECKDAYCRARAYTDQMHKIKLFGPFESKRSITKVAAFPFEQAVLHYLRRRFEEVSRL